MKSRGNVLSARRVILVPGEQEAVSLEGVIRLRKATSLLIVTSCLTLIGCLSGFKHPLGPADEGFIEAQLLGRWECVSTDDPSPGLTITILDFDGKQYYIQAAEPGKDEVSHSRAYATRVEGVPFLNVQGIGPKPEDEWTFLEYVLLDGDHLGFRLVDPQPFEDVIDDAPSVSARLGSRLQDPDVVHDFLSCTRTEAGE
jgi:hypothetical protein